LSDKSYYSGNQSCDEEEPTILKKANNNSKPAVSKRKSSSSSDSDIECSIIKSKTSYSQFNELSLNDLKVKCSFTGQESNLKLSDQINSHVLSDDEPIIIVDEPIKDNPSSIYKSEIIATKTKLSSSSDDECSITSLIVHTSSNSQSNRLQPLRNLKEIDPIILLDSSSSDNESNEDFCIIPIPKTSIPEETETTDDNQFSLKSKKTSNKSESKPKPSKVIDKIDSKSQINSNTYDSQSESNFDTNSSNNINKLKPQTTSKSFDSNDILTTLAAGSYEIILIVDTCETSHA
jgi:hypothetical protein